MPVIKDKKGLTKTFKITKEINLSNRLSYIKLKHKMQFKKKINLCKTCKK